MGLFGGSSASHSRQKVSRDFRDIFEPFKATSLDIADQIKGIGAYGGPWVAGIQPTQTQALGELENLANLRLGNNPADSLITAANRYFDPNYLNVGADPVFQSALEAATRPLEQSRMDQLNRVRAVAEGSGGGLGDRAFLLENAANTGIDQTIADMAAQAAFGELGRRENIQTQAAPQFLAGALGLQETPARLLGEVGGTRREFEQETVVDPAKQAFEEQLQALIRQQLPYQNFLGTTGLPFDTRNSGGGGGGGGIGSILSLLLGVGGILSA